jgi:hypothetical protein
VAKRKPAEKVLRDVLRPDVDGIFRKPGDQWDCAARDSTVPFDRLASDLDAGDPTLRLGALRELGKLGPTAVRHPDLLPRLVRLLIDADTDVRREANELREAFLHERNRVYEWLYEPAQEIRWRSVASHHVGRANSRDAWQEFVYNARATDTGPRFYFYSLPNVIRSFDPRLPNAKPFPRFYLHCFAAYCRKNYRRLRGDRLL